MTDQDPIDLALKQPISADQFTPKDLHLDKTEGLTILWADGVTSRFSLVFLRKACPCATCRTEREKPKPASSGLSLNILPDNISRATEFVNGKLVGNYAMQIEWADGHTTGIYDFRYLRLIDPASQDKTPDA